MSCDVGSQCVSVDEQPEVNTRTDAGASLVEATLDVLANRLPMSNHSVNDKYKLLPCKTF